MTTWPGAFRLARVTSPLSPWAVQRRGDLAGGSRDRGHGAGILPAADRMALARASLRSSSVRGSKAPAVDSATSSP